MLGMYGVRIKARLVTRRNPRDAAAKRDRRLFCAANEVDPLPAYLASDGHGTGGRAGALGGGGEAHEGEKGEGNVRGRGRGT